MKCETETGLAKMAAPSEFDLDLDLDLDLENVDNRPRRSLGAKQYFKKDKLNKKLCRIKRNLSEKECVEFSESPSKILCIQNGGLGNDVSQEDLLSLLSPFGDVEDIIMIRRKQFCFVCFTDVVCSVEVMTNLNGHLLKKGKDPSQDIILYFMYVKKAPANVMPSGEKPPGLHISEDFIDEEKERELLSFVNEQIQSEDTTATGQMKHRRVLHYGYEFKYDINDVDVNEPLLKGIPDNCLPFLKKAQDMGLVSHFPDQLTINRYSPGQGIPPHVDTPPAFEDGIMSLSIGSQAVMDFRHSGQGKHLTVFLPRRSLLVMTGESRYSWLHGITPRKSDIVSAGEGKGLTLVQRGTRTSFTFRKVMKDRSVASQKDSLTSQTLPQTEAEAVALEKVHVHEVYNDIADHFSGTRYKPWPRVVEFLVEQPSYSFVADVGCGNGKCLGAKKDLFEIGCDYSSNLASICRSRGFQTCVADVTCLPFRSDAFDVAICIAVIHHMATRDRRIRAISEVMRILRVGGKALIYVWAMEQNLNQSPSKYIKSTRQKQLMEGSTSSSNDLSQGDKSSSGLSGFSSDKVVDVISTRRREISVGNNNDDCIDTSSNHELSFLWRNSDTGSHNAASNFKETSDMGHGTESMCNFKVNNEIGMDNASSTEIDNAFSNPTVTSGMGIDSASHNSNLTSDTGSDNVSLNSSLTSGNSKSDRCENQPPRNLQVHVNRTQFKDQDMLVPWKLKGQKNVESKDALSCDTKSSTDSQLFHRYYHVFRQGEIEALCKRVSNCVVRKSYYDQGNWCVVLEKV